MPDDKVSTTSDGAVEIRKEYQRRYRLKNKDRLKEYAKQWCDDNKEAIKEKNKAKYKESRDEILASAKAYALNNPEKVKANHAAWMAKNPGRARNHQKAWRKRNPEKASAACRKYYHSDPQKAKARWIKWATENPGKIETYRAATASITRERRRASYHENLESRRAQGRVNQSKRRATKKAAGGHFEEEDILRLYDLQSGLCGLATEYGMLGCQKPLDGKYEIDHIVPLHLGGTNWPDQLQLLCRSCNRRKGHKHPDQWAAELGKLFV